jgi:hypothetical protein
MPTARLEQPSVPAAWQPAVRAALLDLVHESGLAPEAVTVTRVEPAPDGALEVWLLAAGRSRRYRVAGAGPEPVAEPPGA